MSKYPEHDKLAAVQAESQSCGEFVDWLSSVKSLSLCKMHTHSPECYVKHVHDCCSSSCERERDIVCPAFNGQYFPMRERIEDLLAEFFQIDRNTLEVEKRAMLSTMAEWPMSDLHDAMKKLEKRYS